MHSFTNFFLAGLADTFGLLTQSASAADLVQVHNHCSFPLYWWHSASADDPKACDKGVNDLCIGKGGEPFKAAAGSAHGYVILKNDKGVSVKIRRGDKVQTNTSLRPRPLRQALSTTKTSTSKSLSLALPSLPTTHAKFCSARRTQSA